MRYLYVTIEDEHIETMCDAFKRFGYDVIHANSKEILIYKHNSMKDVRLFKNAEDLLQLKQIICAELGIQNVMFPGTKIREKNYAMARHMFYSILRADKYASLEEIGKTWGVTRDHATILHSSKVIDFMIFTKDQEYYPSLQKILAKININEEKLKLKQR